jgi:hypothetical protein
MPYPWNNDDFEQSLTSEVGTMPEASRAVNMGFFNDPLISAEIDNMVQTAELMGYDLSDPEMMGSWLSNLLSKVKGAVKGVQNISITTPQGITQVGAGGVSYTSAPATVPAAALPTTTQKTIGDYLKNPYVVAALVGIPVLLIVMNKRKKAKK